jgi:hypothetical protein
VTSAVGVLGRVLIGQGGLLVGVVLVDVDERRLRPALTGISCQFGTALRSIKRSVGAPSR